MQGPRKRKNNTTVSASSTSAISRSPTRPANNAQWQNDAYQPSQGLSRTRQQVSFSEPDDSMTGWDVGAPLDDGDVAFSIDDFPDILEGMPQEPASMIFGDENNSMLSSTVGQTNLEFRAGEPPHTPPETNSNASQVPSEEPAWSDRPSSRPLPSMTGSSSIKPPFQTHPRRRQHDSECVMRCLQIISGLENYIQASLTVLDLVLDVVRRAVHQLNRLIDMHQHGIAPRVVTLFSTIVLQVVELFEGACAAFIIERDQSNVSFPSGISTYTSGTTVGAASGFEEASAAFCTENSFSFGFGSLSLPIEDQYDVKARLVIRELRQSYEVALRIRTLLRRLTPEPGMAASRDQCFQEVADRLRALVERIDGKRTANRQRAGSGR